MFTRKERINNLRYKKKVSVLLFSSLSLLSGASFLFGESVTHTVKSEDIVVDYKSQFIHSIADVAQELGFANDLYPSVIIAQAIHESDYGRSGLSVYPYYNLFGVKGNYLGSSVLMSTWEDDGSGNAYQIIAPFRQYPSYRESLTDYVSVVKQPWFSGVWRSNTYSYADSTSALQGVYATDTNYSNALNYIIQLHNLTYYDNLNQEDLSSGLVWNSYRGSYTDKSTLDIDVSYATANGIIAEHEEVSNGTGGSNLVWNDYRLQYTSQEVLDEDILWGNH